MSGDGLVNPTKDDDEEGNFTGAPRPLTVEVRWYEIYLVWGVYSDEETPYILVGRLFVPVWFLP